MYPMIRRIKTTSLILNKHKLKLNFQNFINHSPNKPIVTFCKSLLIYSSFFNDRLIFWGVIRFLPSFLASFPAIYNISAAKYSKTADK